MLTPTFDGGVYEYEATTSNATNTITATAYSADATVTILNGDTVVENGEAATWETGENVVTINVNHPDGSAGEYVVTVTKE